MALSNYNWTWEKENPDDTVEWADTGELFDGLFLFRFGPGGRVFNLFRDYPEKLTPDELAIFNRENPYWAEFFADRLAAIKEL